MNARSEFGCKCTVYSQWELFPESFLKILFTGNSKVSSTISKKYFDGILRTNDIVCCYSSPPPPPPPPPPPARPPPPPPPQIPHWEYIFHPQQKEKRKLRPDVGKYALKMPPGPDIN